MRYSLIYDILKSARFHNIMEIGTWNGDNAIKMISAASKNTPIAEIKYYGFDLFEMATADKMSEEWTSEKFPPSHQDVYNRLASTGAAINLYVGDTNTTLLDLSELPRMDMIFIDGGHSIDTIRHDWKCVQQVISKGTTILFDDYNNQSTWGAASIVDAIPRDMYSVEILQPPDVFDKEYGKLIINLAKVTVK